METICILFFKTSRKEIELLKVVYSLVSNITDYYYEQCLVSVISLRKRMKDVDVVILVDDITYGTLTGKRYNIFDYADVIKQDFPEQYDAKIRSRSIMNVK